MPRIDDLLSGLAAVSPLASGDADHPAVGLLQDLLAGHGFTHLPGALSAAYGEFDAETTAAVSTFQRTQHAPATGIVDTAALQQLIAVPATNPLSSRGYVSLVLDVALSQLLRIVTLTTQFEGGGRFCAMNRNTDGAGLSFGLIQWAQRPGRLRELLAAFQTSERGLFVSLLADGDSSLADRLLAHTAKPNGGVTAAGMTTDPAFDLVAEPWIDRFHRAGLDRALQRVQINTALADFTASLQRLRHIAPQISTERGVAFMLDLANQHGDAGAHSILAAVVTKMPNGTVTELLQGIQDESVARVARQFGADNPNTRSTFNRRNAFRTSPLLSDSPMPLT